jgi:hypothetical protein
MDLLDGLPQAFPTACIVGHCGGGLRCPRSTIWAHLRRLERGGLVAKVSVVRGRGEGTRWRSTKWED